MFNKIYCKNQFFRSVSTWKYDIFLYSFVTNDIFLYIWKLVYNLIKNHILYIYVFKSQQTQCYQVLAYKR